MQVPTIYTLVRNEISKTAIFVLRTYVTVFNFTGLVYPVLKYDFTIFKITLFNM